MQFARRVDSKFRFILVAAKRARQLQAGAKPLVQTAFKKVTKIAQMAHDGIARAVNPAHTPFDGDTLFALTTGTSSAKVHHGIIGALAAEAVSEAIIRAVK